MISRNSIVFLSFLIISISAAIIVSGSLSDIPSTAPEVCQSYYGDKVCDDSVIKCGSAYKSGVSVDSCQEIETGGYTIQSSSQSSSASCVNSCGTKSPSGCYCDAASITTYKDSCSDIQTACPNVYAQATGSSSSGSSSKGPGLSSISAVTTGCPTSGYDPGYQTWGGSCSYNGIGAQKNVACGAAGSCSVAECKEYSPGVLCWYNGYYDANSAAYQQCYNDPVACQKANPVCSKNYPDCFSISCGVNSFDDIGYDKLCNTGTSTCSCKQKDPHSVTGTAGFSKYLYVTVGSSDGLIFNFDNKKYSPDGKTVISTKSYRFTFFVDKIYNPNSNYDSATGSGDPRASIRVVDIDGNVIANFGSVGHKSEIFVNGPYVYSVSVTATTNNAADVHVSRGMMPTKSATVHAFTPALACNALGYSDGEGGGFGDFVYCW